MAKYYLDDDGNITTKKKKKKGTEYVLTESGKVAKVDDDIAPVATKKNNKKDEDDDNPSFKDLTVNSFMRGVYNSKYGQESYKAMGGLKNDKEYYANKLSEDEYSFETDKWYEQMLSGVSEQLGQWYTQYTDPKALTGAGAGVTSALLLGQAGPQVALPEEVITAPALALAGWKAGGTATAFEIETGHAYNEMIEKGISPKTASILATGAGLGVATLDTIQLDELVKSYKILDKMGADKTLLKTVGNYLAKRGANTAFETAMEVGQEGIVMGATEIGSRLENGESAYSGDEAKDRLIDTAKQSALTFAGMGVGGDIATHSVNTVTNKVANAIESKPTETEQKVINKVVEKEVAEREANGEKLTNKEKNAIYDNVVESVQNGSLDVETIEEVLGGESYEAYKKATDENASLKNELKELNGIKAMELTGEQSDRLAELKAMNLDDTTKTDELRKNLSEGVFNIVKGDRNGQGSMLLESYRERERRTQAFEADLTKYEGKQKEAVERAIKSGVLNNTNRSHELVNILSKIEADKGITFDYTDNAKLKESGFAVEGKTVNGFVKDGGVTLNVQSPKAWESTVGHEIGHVLKGTEAYGALQSSLFEYAKSRGELETRRAALAKLYEGLDADIDEELTSDLIGDYLFNDKNFIKHLTSDRNVFQKVWDEVKYLYNIATGKEKAQIEKVKREFEKVWMELSAETKTTDKTKYSMSGENAENADYSMLAKAKSMFDSGTDGETIRQETGWHKGYDGKWRFEIDDSDFKFHPKGQFSNPDVLRRNELLDKFLSSEVNQAEWEELQRLENTLKGVKKIPKTLEDYVEHENLFRAYPQLADVKLKLYSSNDFESLGNDKDTSGYYSPSSNTIVINKDINNTTEKVKQTLIHEIQHAIQHIEGFANGASVEYWKEQRRDIVDTISGARENLGLWLNDIGYDEFSKASLEKVISREKTLEQHWEDCKEFKANSKYAKQIANCEAELAEFQRQYDEITNGMTAYEQYENTAGEIEARDAESRLNLNAEERKNKRPDIDRENVVFADTKYSLSTDSEGNNLTPEQQSKFENSKVRDADGHLIPLYHGSESEAFSVFDMEKGVWLAADQRYSEVYAGQWHSWRDDAPELAYRRTDINGLEPELYTDPDLRVYKVYADIQNPLDIGEIDGYLSDGKVGALARALGVRYSELKAISDNYMEEPTYMLTRSEEFIELAKSKGFDGFKATESGRETWCAIQSSDQIKLTTNKTPTIDDDVRYSLSEDSNGNELSLAVQKRFANSKAVDENGNLKVLYHGTASGEFYTFDKSKGSVEGDFGSGFYFTDSESDVEANYEDSGADFDNKVARRAEQIESEEDIDYSEAEARAREELYKGGFKHSVYLNIENPAIVGETYLLDYESFAEEYDREDYDSDEDYEGDVEQLIADKIDEIIWDIDRNVDIYSTDGISDVLWNAINEGGIGIEQLKAQINELYLEDNDGNFVGNEVTRQIIESLGYDGIIDPTVSTKFNMGLDEGTTHYIVFKPNQIKSIDNQNPTDNPDIRKSLSNTGEQPSTKGTPLRDLYLEQDIAPVTDTNVGSNEVTKAETPYADYAPATAEEVEALNKGSFDAITDEDAPPETVQQVDYLPDSISLDTKTLKALSKAIGKILPLSDKYAKADLEKVIQDFSKGEIASKEDLYKEVAKRFDKYYLKQKEELLEQIKREVRKIPIYVSDKVKGDFGRKADGYLYFMRKHFGKIRFAKNGVSADKFYDVLNSAFGEAWFPSEIWNQAERLRRIAEVVDMPTTTFVAQPVDKETLEHATNLIYDNVQDYKSTVRLADSLRMADAPIDESLIPPVEEGAEDVPAVEEVAPIVETNSERKPPISERLADGTRGEELLYESLDNHPVETVEQKVAENIRAVEGQLADERALRIETEADYNRRIAELQAEYASKKDKHTMTAYKLLESISRQERLKATNDARIAKRISDLEARLEKMKTPEYSRAMRRQAKMQEHADFAKNLLGDISKWVDKKLGLQYATNTERRNLRDIVRDENGNVDIAHADEINDALNGKYNREEANKKRELAQKRGKFADLKITKAEDVYIQMLGEFKYNPDTTLSKKDVDEYYEKHKSKIDIKKVDKVIEMARKDYDDFFIRVNEALREQGMAEIPYRKGYFPHTHTPDPKQNFLQKLLNWKMQNHEIPTSIAGLTEDFRPGKSWQPFDKRRKGDKTEYSFAKGYDKYSEGALDWIYHLDTIQKRRAVENYIRSAYSEEGIKAKIKEVYANEEYDANEAQAQIEQILSVSESHLSHFVQDFTTHTNILANKKNSLDRTVEQMTNRSIYSVMQNVQNRMSANMVLANVRSALTNFIPITQSWAQVSPMRSLQATKDTIANAIKDDGLINKSTFLTNRLREVDNLYQTNWDKVLDKAGIMFEVIDNFSSQVIWRSKYNQNLSKGMSEAEAIANADQFAENVMAGRSKGNEPTLFNAKNPFVKAFTMFQLEVNNQYGYLFKDVPNDLKAETNHWKLNLAKGLTTAFIGAYVYNELLSKITGSDAALDPIGIIEDLLRDLGFFDDDEEKEPDEIVTNLTQNVVEELPFVGGLFGGGRIPISSAIPYGGEYGGGLSGAIKDVTEGNWKNVGKEMMNPILNVGLPVGGGQIKKTVQGLKMFSDEHPVTGSYTDSGALRFPVEDTTKNRIQAGLFGQYASENAREYFDNGYAPLKEKQIQEYQDVDLPIADYWKYREGLSGLKTLNEKGDYIGGLDLPVDKKNILINNIADRKTPIDFTGYEDYANFEEFDFATRYPEKYAVLKEQGISVADYKENYQESAFMYTDDYSWAANNPEAYAVSKSITNDVSEYKQYTADLYNIKADKDANGKSINGSRKNKVLDYINNLDIDYEAKLILFKSEYPSDDTYNYEIIEYINNRQDLTDDERVSIYTKLGFTVKDGYVYWD